MGKALAEAAIVLGHEVLIISGPVNVHYPSEAHVIPVVTTDDLLEVCVREFATCDGVIGAAAPCDYKPIKVKHEKIQKTGGPLELSLVECPDVVATLGAAKRPDQWTVGFALETEDANFRAITKMQKKCCDLMVLNGPAAMNSMTNDVEILNPTGKVIQKASGDKRDVGRVILEVILRELVDINPAT